ncbi:hypothetical protein MUO79_01010 [Candidatus Bathyarchaeota archaeon]|nr:hypothetical protein [Candidatus Bathyarchaeota archaeon]
MALQIRVDKTKLETFMRLFPEKQAKILEAWKEEGSRATMESMRRHVPFRAGYLRESVTRKLTAKGFTVWPAASYAPFVDQGTRPHTIYPVNAKVLRWYGPYGEAVFSKSVHHPGFAGRFFMSKTKEEMGPVLRQLLLLNIQEGM